MAEKKTYGATSGRIRWTVLAVAAFALGFLIRGGTGDVPTGDARPAAVGERATVWTCSMHPQVRLPDEGQCPICFMDLIPIGSGDGEGLGPRTVAMSAAAAALADIRTAPVERRPVTGRLRLVGKVTYDETATRTIAAWVPGRIDTLFVDFTGAVVRKGQPLVSLYSPPIHAAQTELLGAVAAVRDLGDSDSEAMRRTAAATVASARERLRLWGMTGAQVAAVESRGAPSHHLRVASPLGGVVVRKDAVEGLYVDKGASLYTVADLTRVWVRLEAYESDLAWLRTEERVRFAVEALPGREFEGTIAFIDPLLDEGTRTVHVRLEVPNGDGLLKPGMFVSAVARPELSSGKESLVIPATAPLITGERAVVYVRLPDRERPVFQGREVVLGPRAGDVYVVESGLAEGEAVVVNGAFKIDSALQIRAEPSMMNPEGAASAPGHDHGAAPAQAGAGGHASAAPSPLDAPAAFRDRLDGLLRAYLVVQDALAADDDGAAARGADSLAGALAAVDMTLLEGAAHRAWMDDLRRLRPAADALRGAGELKARREAFLPLTEALWEALRRFGFQGRRTVRLFHCPMAFQGGGGDWLQMDQTAANPYFGSSMLRCGSQTDSIAALKGGEGDREHD